MRSEDDAVLKAVLERQSQRAHHQITLPALIADWQRFVAEVRTGYGAMLADYTNSLSGRGLLAELIAALPPDAAGEIERVIAPADDEYRAATRPSERPLLPRPRGVHSWWWFRVPIRAGEDLVNDLREDGFGEVSTSDG